MRVCRDECTQTLSIDFETRSPVDLKKTGVYPYAADPDTDIWLMAWAFDDEEPELWFPPPPVQRFVDGHGVDVTILSLTGAERLPQRILEHIAAGGEIRGWNVMFERIMWREIMVKRYGAPPVPLEQWVDTAAEAAAMALPRSLDMAAKVTGVPFTKDMAGNRLMLRMARPRSVNEDGTYVWWNDPEKIAKLGAYCKQDVRTEHAISKVVRRLSPHERKIYLLDQSINDRGIGIDRPLVNAAQDIVEEGVDRANADLIRITSGAVTEVTKVAALKSWLATKDVEVTSLDKAHLKELLDSPELPFDVNQALQLRADVGRSSVAKLDSMLSVIGKSDRARGLLLYHGAGTGRWSGKLVQPQNFPRGEVDDIESFIPDVLARDYDALDLIAPPIVIVLSMLRSMMVGAPGNDLIAGDYSAIEARVLNWISGQDDMLDLFRQYDAAPKQNKPLYDPYRHNAARLYKIPLADVQKFPHRQTGKFQELGCGYQMGAIKAVNAAKSVYGLIISGEEAKEIVKGYRDTHPDVVQLWRDANNAAIEATAHPGRVVRLGVNDMLKFVVAGAYLYLILPSGRALAYAAPHIVEEMTEWGTRPQVEFWGMNSFTHQWQQQRLYGGLIVENAVQAISRDLIADGMLRLEEAGYPVVLSVHDEVVCEIPEGFGSLEEFEHLLTALPDWAEGCPVSSESWRGKRYRK